MRERVSLCMIVKDEAENLPACLDSVLDLVDELVVADTGSTDNTPEIARRYGARLVEAPWTDNFAAARNASLRHATGDWIFWMDADDRLDAVNRQQLQVLFDSLPAGQVCFLMRCHGSPDAGTLTGFVVSQPRLFRRHLELCWEYRVHEQIWPSIARIGGVFRESPVVIEHRGYDDSELRQRKRERNLRLLHLEDGERPNDPYILFNLGAIYHQKGEPETAGLLLQRSLERARGEAAYVPVAYRVLSQCQLSLGQPAAALAVCQAGRRQYPADAHLLFQEAVLQGAQGDRRAEEACLLQILRLSPPATGLVYDPGLWTYKVRHNLAVLCRDQGRLKEAEEHWRSALAAMPRFALGWQGLAQVYLDQQRWPELEQVLQQLEAGLLAREETTLLRAQAHLARREFTAARRLLEAVLPQYPQSLPLHRYYSQALLWEGHDWDAAERALRHVLALDPHQETSRKNLLLLLQHRTARA